jgi:hypothetical protein
MANRSPESGRQWVGQLLQQSVLYVALKSSSSEDRRNECSRVQLWQAPEPHLAAAGEWSRRTMLPWQRGFSSHATTTQPRPWNETGPPQYHITQWSGEPRREGETTLNCEEEEQEVEVDGEVVGVHVAAACIPGARLEGVVGSNRSWRCRRCWPWRGWYIFVCPLVPLPKFVRFQFNPN